MGGFGAGHAMRGLLEELAFVAQAIVGVGGDFLPELGSGDEGKVRDVSVPGFTGGSAVAAEEGFDPVEFGAQGIGVGEPTVGFPEFLNAEVVAATLGEGDGEAFPGGLLDEGDVLAEELLLEGNRAGGDDEGPLLVEEGNQVSEALAGAGAGFDDGVEAVRDGRWTVSAMSRWPGRGFVHGQFLDDGIEARKKLGRRSFILFGGIPAFRKSGSGLLNLGRHHSQDQYKLLAAALAR